MIHADRIKAARITVQEALRMQKLMGEWLAELEEQGRLSPEQEDKFVEMLDRLWASIDQNQRVCPSCGGLHSRPLNTVELYRFKEIISWANETFPEHFKTFREGLN